MKYNTKQREEIIKYLKTNEHNHICVEDIENYLLENNLKINKSTIYRFLNTLIKENQIRRVKIDDKACYQMIIDEDCHHEIHFLCNNCNQLYHLEETKEYLQFLKTFQKKFDLLIDDTKTVFYGLCNECKEKKI